MSFFRAKRITIAALLFISAASFHFMAYGSNAIFSAYGLQMQQEIQSNYPPPTAGNITTKEDIANTPRLQYIRPPGNAAELLSIFEQVSNPDSQTMQNLPQSAKEIAERYGLPLTSRDTICNPNSTTTIGWIPSELSSAYYNTSTPNIPFTYDGKIPKLIFQSWKTDKLEEKLCNHVLIWSRMNPEYDYFLFNDDAIDTFIRLEYGREIFSSYACVKVGAAKCDVWRLLMVYLYGGLYFDFDTRLQTKFSEWNWGPERDVVTARSCTAAPKKHPGGCAHQWGLVYAPRHRVLYDSIRETLTNLAERTATNVYDISFWSYYHAWRSGPYNQSYMPGWGEEMGGRVKFQDDDAKDVMVEGDTHWQKQKQMWHPECM